MLLRSTFCFGLSRSGPWAGGRAPSRRTSSDKSTSTPTFAGRGRLLRTVEPAAIGTSAPRTRSRHRIAPPSFGGDSSAFHPQSKTQTQQHLTLRAKRPTQALLSSDACRLIDRNRAFVAKTQHP